MNDNLMLEVQGYLLIESAFSPAECDRLLSEWSDVTERQTNAAVLRTAAGVVYGARNLLELWPEVARIVQHRPLATFLTSILGTECGLVRVLFFDKSPEQSWALPWHKDLSIAVKDNRRSSPHFRKPTTKYGVPHVEASEEVLQRMLTVRVHLDEVTDENGPLKVLPGSHRHGKRLVTDGAEPHTIRCRRGDVLAMRPLLTHASGHSVEGTTRHRRILHFESAGVKTLSDGYEWHDFIPINGFV